MTEPDRPTASGCPAALDGAEFDHTSADHAEHWPRIYREARQGCPVVRSANHGGYHVLTRHADVTAALRDHRRFSSERSWNPDGSDRMRGVAIPSQPVRVGILEIDPPDSLPSRRLLNSWFTRGAIERGRSRITEAASWAVDQVVEQGACDIVSDLASPFQCVVILDLLGVPLDRWQKYNDVAERMVRQTDDRHEGVAWMRQDLREEVLRQRSDGGPGLIGGLVRSELDGAPIDVEWATELVLMLLLGGEGTTIATIAHMLLHLDEHPADTARLLDDRSLVAPAVDEILRISSPSPGLARTVTEEVTLSGHTFVPGDRVLLSFASANRDESVFADADTVDIARSPNPHLAFGAGAHRCIGVLLAKANVEALLDAVLSRMPDFAIVRDGVRPYDRIPLTNGCFSAPMTYTPGARLAPSGGDLPQLTAPRVAPV